MVGMKRRTFYFDWPKVDFGTTVNSCRSRDRVHDDDDFVGGAPRLHVKRHRFSTKARARGENNERLARRGTQGTVSKLPFAEIKAENKY